MLTCAARHSMSDSPMSRPRRVVVKRATCTSKPMPGRSEKAPPVAAQVSQSSAVTMYSPEIQLQRLSEECQKLCHKVHTSSSSSCSGVQDPVGQSGEHLSISDPEFIAPTQVLLSRNGVGKTTIVNHELMLGQVRGARASYVLAAAS